MRRHTCALVVGLSLAGTCLRLRAQEDDCQDIQPYDLVVYRNPAGDAEPFVCRILSETPELIEIQKINPDGTPGLKTSFSISKIDSISRSCSADKVYQTKRRRVPGPKAPPEQRAAALSALGLWCRTPHPALDGAPPAWEHAFGHLIRSVRLNPKLVEVYPHLLDVLAEKRLSGESAPELEMEIYLLAETGGFEHAEIEFRKGEIYLEAGLEVDAAARFATLTDVAAGANHSLRRRARWYLSEVHLARGDVDAALELFRPPATLAPEDPESFDLYYVAGRILLETRDPARLAESREYLEEARELQPTYAGVAIQLAAIDLLEGKLKEASSQLASYFSRAKTDPEYLIVLGLVYLQQGRYKRAQERFQMAEERLEVVAEGARDAVASLFHLARGLLADYTADLASAAREYASAWKTAPWNRRSDLRLVAGLLLARTRLVSGDPDAAREVMDALVRSYPDDPGVFAAYARLVSDLERGKNGPSDRSLRLLDHATRFQGDDAFLRWRYGYALMEAGELEAAFTHLLAARQLDARLPEVHGTLGYYHYRRGELDEAEKSFREVLKLTPKSVAALAAEEARRLASLRQYAEWGIEQILDVRRLEVWDDTFEREDGGEILRGWIKVENYGVPVQLEKGRVVFSGTQRTRPDGVTKLYREAASKNVERLAVSLRFASGSRSRVRAGIRIESTKDDTGAGVVFGRSLDGKLSIAVRTSRNEWKDLQPSPKTDKRERGKMFFPADNIVWPGDGKYHRLSIRRADSTKGGKGLDFFFDGREVARNVQLSGITSTRVKTYYVGVSGQTDGLDVSYRFEADDFRIFRKKTVEERRGAR